MADIADTSELRRASTDARARPAASAAAALTPLAEVSATQWRALSERAADPNGYYLPEWESAVNASARGRGGASALVAFGEAGSLIGLLPVVSMWRAYGIALPVLVSADPYGSLSTPLLEADRAEAAADALLNRARQAGAHALILRDAALDGAAMSALAGALRRDGLIPRIMQSHVRAALDATGDADQLLREALGPKKLKELRRQRNRLGEMGEVRFEVARAPAEIAVAVETFLQLEASGWKARRGTALLQDAGDAAFIRRATSALAANGQCEIVMLNAGPTPVAAAVVLRHRDRAFYFKLGVDERFARMSPGVQLTLELTRHLCADPAIALVDSTANADHPMINPIWRQRLAIGDVLIPLYRRGVVATLAGSALTLRRRAREPVRRVLQMIRKRQEKPA